MAAINPAAWMAWALLLALPIGFGFLALSRLSTPPSGHRDQGGPDAAE